MFAKFAVALSTLAVLVAAVPTPGYPTSASQCNTGAVQCCNTLSQSGSTQANQLLGNFIGLDVGTLTGTLGFDCNPITVIGGAVGTNCAQQPVCCQGNQANGLVNFGCSPISA